MSTTIALFRPVGQKEMDLIRESGYRNFPPFQPFFYPVIQEEYAVQIGRDWNTKDPASGYAGYVTSFRIDAEYPEIPARNSEEFAASRILDSSSRVRRV